MGVYKIRLDTDSVTELRQLVRRMNFEGGTDLKWTDLVRKGVDVILDGERAGVGLGDPARGNA